MTHPNVEPDKSHTRTTSERHRRSSTELRVQGSHVDAWGISLHDTAAAAAVTASKRPAERGRHDYRYIITHFSVSWRIPPCLLLSFTTCLDIFLSLALCPRLSLSFFFFFLLLLCLLFCQQVPRVEVGGEARGESKAGGFTVSNVLLVSGVSNSKGTIPPCLGFSLLKGSRSLHHSKDTALKVTKNGTPIFVN